LIEPNHGEFYQKSSPVRKVLVGRRVADACPTGDFPQRELPVLLCPKHVQSSFNNRTAEITVMIGAVGRSLHGTSKFLSETLLTLVTL